MAKLDQKFKKKSAYKFDDEEGEHIDSQRKELKKYRREIRQRSAEHAADLEHGSPFWVVAI